MVISSQIRIGSRILVPVIKKVGEDVKKIFEKDVVSRIEKKHLYTEMYQPTGMALNQGYSFQEVEGMDIDQESFEIFRNKVTTIPDKFVEVVTIFSEAKSFLVKLEGKNFYIARYIHELQEVYYFLSGFELFV